MASTTITQIEKIRQNLSKDLRGTKIIMKNKVENYLAQLKNHHRETYEHCVRVASNCRKLSTINSLPP